jgi:hypothetical protein
MEGDMKIGDFIRWNHKHRKGEHTGIILEFTWNGDSVNVLWQDGEIEEVEVEHCEVLSAGQ